MKTPIAALPAVGEAAIQKRAAVRKHSSPWIGYRLNYAGNDAN